MDKMAMFLFNVILNSFISFCLVAGLIELILFFFRVRQGRFSAFLRMIPLIKLPLDLFFYDFSTWCYTHGVDPILLAPGTRAIGVMVGWWDNAFPPLQTSICFSSGETTFTPADVIASFAGITCVRGIVGVFAAIGMGVLIRMTVALWRACHRSHLLKRSALPSNRPVGIDALDYAMRQHGLSVVVSASPLLTPCVAGCLSPTIYLPANYMKGLSDGEYHAVLAHELGHVSGWDGPVRVSLHLISAVFWWIPTRWLLNRIEAGQEIGCDRQCLKFGIDPADLAMALCKAARNFASHAAPLRCLSGPSLQERLEELLHPQKFSRLCMGLAFATAVLFIIPGKFFIF